MTHNIKDYDTLWDEWLAKEIAEGRGGIFGDPDEDVEEEVTIWAKAECPYGGSWAFLK